MTLAKSDRARVSPASATALPCAASAGAEITEDDIAQLAAIDFEPVEWSREACDVLLARVTFAARLSQRLVTMTKPQLVAAGADLASAMDDDDRGSDAARDLLKILSDGKADLQALLEIFQSAAARMTAALAAMPPLPRFAEAAAPHAAV